jgi:transposase-like protein
MTDSRAVRCPFCNATATELISLFGSQLLLSQYRCKACGTYFEGVRDDNYATQSAVSTIEGDAHGRGAE